MNFILRVWEYGQGMLSFLFYVGIFAILVLLEKRLIQKRSKGEWILPAGLLIVALVLSVTTFTTNYGSGPNLEHGQVFVGNQEVGRLLWIINREDNNVVAMGQYVAGDNEKARFIDLKVIADKVTEASEPISRKEKNAIEEIFSYRKGKFTGQSVSYGELVSMDAAKSTIRKEITWMSVVHGMRVYGLPGLVLLTMYLWSLVRRKKANAMLKSRLKDI